MRDDLQNWVFETYIGGRLMREHSPIVYTTTHFIAGALLELDLGCHQETRIRAATAEEMLAARQITIDPDCRDWMIVTSFDGEAHSRLYRDKRVDEIIVLANKQVSSVLDFVSFRPATVSELADDAKEQAEWEAASRQELRHTILWSLAYVGGLVIGFVCREVVKPQRFGWIVVLGPVAAVYLAKAIWETRGISETAATDDGEDAAKT